MPSIEPNATSLNSIDTSRSMNPVVLCAADDNYAMPLTVMIRSAAETLEDGARLTVIVLDGGIKPENWQRLRSSVAGLPVEIHSLCPDVGEVADLMISHHITHTAYFRLLAGRLLPENIDRVIYLDSDVLVRRSLTELWRQPVGDDYCLAVPDIACPFVDARYAGCNFVRSSPWMAVLRPIGNWRELGLDPSAYYFNSGVMLINVRRWREESIENRLLDTLRQNPRYVWCWDQYALNVVFAGHWRPLPLAWNQGAHVYEFPGEEHSPVDVSQFREARDNPAIVHFTTEWKPWHFRNHHPLKHLFFEMLDRTEWREWRPQRPPFSLRKSWDALAVEVIKRSVNWYRRRTARWVYRGGDGLATIPALAQSPTGDDRVSVPIGSQIGSP